MRSLPMMFAGSLLSVASSLQSSAYARPQIFWASDPVRPGEAALLVGHGFSSHPAISVTRLDDDSNLTSKARSGKQAATKVKAVQVSDASVKFLIPAAFKAGVYKVRVATRKGSNHWLLNAPTIYWAQGDNGTSASHVASASPGGWIRVFGRCLIQGSRRPKLRMIASKERTSRVLTATSASPWDVRFDLPADLKSGSYDLQLHSGFGDRTAWSEVGKLDVRDPETWPQQIFDVRKFGAVGTGDADDTSAVLAAVKAAKDKGGGIVYFPRGRYRVQTTLVVPRWVTLRGERRDLVSILWADMDHPPHALVQGSNHFAIEDLTLYASSYEHVIAGDLEPTRAGQPGNVRVQRVTVRALLYTGLKTVEEVDQRFRRRVARFGVGNGDTLRLGGPHLVITDNDIYGSARSLFLLRPRGAYVARNRFYNGRWGWYCLSGVDGLIFEDNQIAGADLMSTGGGINDLYGTMYSQNVFFARNKLSLMFGWDREAMTSDAGSGLYYGSVRPISNRIVVLPKEMRAKRALAKANHRGDWKGAGVFVLGGKGMGQFAQIDQKKGTVVRLDRPWKVRPNQSSVITITMMQQNYLFVDNTFTDVGVALQYFGTSINHIASGNRATRSAGFYNSGRWYRHYQPSWYCQFLDNEILEGNVYRAGPDHAKFAGDAFLGTVGKQRPPNTAPLALAAIHRRNHLFSNAHLEIRGGDNPKAPGTRDVILENNIVENADLGLKVDAGVVGVLEHGDTFKHVTVAVEASTYAPGTTNPTRRIFVIAAH